MGKLGADGVSDELLIMTFAIAQLQLRIRFK